jgi:hypothetical protein
MPSSLLFRDSFWSARASSRRFYKRNGQASHSTLVKLPFLLASDSLLFSRYPMQSQRWHEKEKDDHDAQLNEK